MKTLLFGTAVTVGAVIFSLRRDTAPVSTPRPTVVQEIVPSKAAPQSVHRMKKPSRARVVKHRRYPTPAAVVAKPKTKHKPYFIVGTTKRDNQL